RHGEVFLQVEVERARERREVARGGERYREPVDLLADGVVFLAELDQLAEPRLQHLHLVAQRHRLALGERNGAAAMGMRHVDRFDEIGMLVEELRVGAQEAREVVGVHGSCSSIVPSNTAWAGLSSPPDCRRPAKRWSTR